MKIIIRNAFHGTTTSTNVRDGSLVISAEKVRRIRRTLCGHKGCTCGGDLSERGNSEMYAVEDYNGDPMAVRIFTSGGEAVFQYVSER